jgi:phosphoribosylglycinamide formyltransferase-1
VRLGFLASHDGSNVQAIIDACRDGRIDGEPRVLISNNSGARALERARAAGIDALHISAKTHDDPDVAICDALESRGVELVVLAGYMRKLGPRTLGRFPVVNVHPALLPRHGGRGMYGRAVHEAVLASGDAVTGATVHLVDDQYDHGPVVAQREIAVEPGDTVESLSARVLKLEHELYVETIGRIASGEIRLP